MKQTIDLTVEQQAISAHRAQLEKHADLEGEKIADAMMSGVDPKQFPYLRDILVKTYKIGFMCGYDLRDGEAMGELIGQEHRLGGKIDILEHKLSKIIVASSYLIEYVKEMSFKKDPKAQKALDSWDKSRS